MKNEASDEPQTGRLSMAKLRKIWNDDEVTYTDDELYRIRNWFYMIAEITVSSYSRQVPAEETSVSNYANE